MKYVFFFFHSSGHLIWEHTQGRRKNFSQVLFLCAVAASQRRARSLWKAGDLMNMAVKSTDALYSAFWISFIEEANKLLDNFLA